MRIAVFLVDVFCLGVKSAFSAVESPLKYDESCSFPRAFSTVIYLQSSSGPTFALSPSSRGQFYSLDKNTAQ